MQQSSALYDPVTASTPTQLLEAAKRAARLQRINGLGRSDAGIISPSASQRSAGDAIKAILPDPTMDEVKVGYIPPPWIPDRRSRLEIRTIQNRVCVHYNVSRADMLSARRTKELVRPRQLAIYLSKKLTPKSLPQIGRAFGGRDHSTALWAIRQTATRIESDSLFAATVAEIVTDLEAYW